MAGPAEAGAGSTLPTAFANRCVSEQNLTGSAGNECRSFTGSLRLQRALRYHAIVMVNDIG